MEEDGVTQHGKVNALSSIEPWGVFGFTFWCLHHPDTTWILTHGEAKQHLWSFVAPKLLTGKISFCQNCQTRMKFWNSQKLAHVDKLFILAGKYNSSMDVLQKVFESLGQGTTTCIFSLFFIMGEAKLFPFKGHMITRHEVLAALF